jgi:ABC-type phosphate/phosphonate transport system permease subunit
MEIVFRALAGVLAVLFLFVVFISPPPMIQAISMSSIGVLFAVFAIFGRDAADRLLAKRIGARRNDPDQQ